MSLEGKWGHTYDDEIYYGDFDTAEEAAIEGLSGDDGRITVGRYRAPRQPEEAVSAEDILELVDGMDDYANDWADGWCRATSDQIKELEQSLRRTFAEWLDRHGLRPQFGLVCEERRYEVVDGQPRLVKTFAETKGRA